LIQLARPRAEGLLTDGELAGFSPEARHRGPGRRAAGVNRRRDPASERPNCRPVTRMVRKIPQKCGGFGRGNGAERHCVRRRVHDDVPDASQEHFLFRRIRSKVQPESVLRRIAEAALASSGRAWRAG
jgi:hypothetical protein